MSDGFVHSVKVPRFYKTTANIVKNVAEEGASLKQLVYERRHPNIAGTYGLAVTTLQNASQLDELLRKSQLLLKEKRLDPWLARILIAELLWGKKTLKSEAKPVKTVLSYEKELRDLLINLDNPTVPTGDKQVKKPRYVRVNTLVTSVEDTISSFTSDGWILMPKSPDYSSFLISLSRLNASWFVRDFHIPELLAFPFGTKFHDDPRYKSGAIVLQDKASCFPAFLLKPTPGSTVLDMCAAPGMKTTHLAAIMQNKGKIFAVEKNRRRYETLCKLVGANNANCVETLNADSMTLDAKKCPNVEYILVDPSCSGSGMADRLIIESTVAKCAPGRLRSLQSFQVLLLRHALLNFPKAKRVVYSTCSLYPEENEMVVDEVLASIEGSYKLKSVKKLLSGNWKNFSSTDYSCKNKCLYARSEIDYSNGFFVAIFERNFDVPLPAKKCEKALVKLERSEEESSLLKRNNVNGDGEDIGKKQRKKNKSNGGTMINATSMGEETPKRKRKRAESVETGKIVKTESPMNPDESLAKKSAKTKKKKKQFGLEESGVNGTNEDYENLLIQEKRAKREMKNKKKRVNPDASMKFIEMDEGNNENLPNEGQRVKKEAKKKKKRVNGDASVPLIEAGPRLTAVSSETRSSVDRGIKKKKRVISIVSDEVVIR